MCSKELSGIAIMEKAKKDSGFKERFSYEHEFYEEFAKMIRRVSLLTDEKKGNINILDATDEQLQKLDDGWFQYSIKVKLRNIK